MRRNLKYVFILGMLCGALLSACGFNPAGLVPSSVTRVSGSGNVVTESRPVSGFDGIIVNGAGKLLVDRNGTESLSITTDDNLLQYIVTEVRGGKLVIEFKPGIVIDRSKDLTFRVTAKDMNSFDVNGAANAELSGMDSSQLGLDIDGAAFIRAAGKAQQLNLKLNGTGAYAGENLAAQRATVTNNGLGSAVVRVSDELNATINGAGRIEYIGNPKVTKQINGIGVVQQRSGE